MKKFLIILIAAFSCVLIYGETHEVRLKQDTQVTTSKGVFTAKKNTTADFDENDRIIAFIPEKDSVIRIDSQELKLKSKAEFILYEDGSVKEISVDITDQDVDISGIKIFAKTVIPVLQGNAKINDFEKEYSALPTWLTISFYKSGVPSQIKVYESKAASLQAFSTSNNFNNSYFMFQYGELGVKAKKITFNEKFGLSAINMFPAYKVLTKDENLWYDFTVFAFSDDSSQSVRAGIICTKSLNGSFYDRKENILLVFKDGKAVNAVKDQDMFLYPEIKWSEDNSVISYTAYDKDKNTVIKQIKQ